MKSQWLGVVAAGVVSGLLISPAVHAAQRDKAAVCIAVVLPGVQGVEGNATEVGSSVRDLFVSFLTGPSLRAVALDARLASQGVEEARQKQCGQVLSVSLTRKASSGGGGWLGRAVGQAGTSMAWGIPGGSVGSAVARGATVAASQAVAELAGSTKAKDEMRIEYRLTSIDGKATLGSKNDKLKAKADGEDLVTPLVQRAAEAVAAAVAR